MKVLFCIVSIVILLIVVNGSGIAYSPGDTIWARTYGGAAADSAYSIQQTADGGYILAGHTWTANQFDFLLVRTDVNGDTLWTHRYGGAQMELAYYVLPISDGGFVVAGYTNSYGAGDYDFYVVRTDSDGNEIWARTYGGTNTDKCYSIHATTDGGFVAAGHTRSFGAGLSDFYVVKISATGTQEWARTFGGSLGDEAYSVRQTSDGGYCIAGWTSSSGFGGEDVYLVKTDSQGNIEWTRNFGGAMDEWAFSVRQTLDDGFILTGMTHSFGAGNDDVYVIRTNAGGDTLWTRTFGGALGDEGCTGEQVSDGGFLIGGRCSSFGAGGMDAYLLKLDPYGTLQWERAYGGTQNDDLMGVIEAIDGSYVVDGYTYSFGSGSADFYLLKIYNDGSSQTLTFTYPEGQPAYMNSAGGSILKVEVSGANGIPEPGTGTINYNYGMGWNSMAMNEIQPNIYEAVFPSFDCGSIVRYYLSAQNNQGETFNDPANAPISTYSASATIMIEDNFETDMGWTVQNVELSDGAWERALVIGGGNRGDPPTDYDGSGRCYVTDNAGGNSDVDGGPTRLISPLFDLEGKDGIFSYARWFYCDDNDQDRLTVEVSNNGGASWVVVESIPHTIGWVSNQILASDYVLPTSQMKLRFSATDNPNNSVTEAGIDAFMLIILGCSQLPAVSVDLTPDNAPIVVQPGGFFTYTGGLSNNTSSMLTTDIWVMLDVPNYGIIGPLMYFNNFPMNPNQIVTFPGVRQNVPNYAQIGDYTYIAYCGEYPAVAIDSSSFGFTVISGVVGNESHWNLIGWFGGSSVSIPKEFALNNNYPNPFNTSTIIRYSLPGQSEVSVDIYNLMGEKVASLIHGMQPAGEYSIEWDGSNYSSGIYLYSLKADNFRQVRRMILLK